MQRERKVEEEVGVTLTRVSAGFALCPVIKEPPPSLRIGVSLEILVRFTYFTVKGSTRGEVKEDRCLAEDARRGVGGGGGGGDSGGGRAGGYWEELDGNPAELLECGWLQRC